MDPSLQVIHDHITRNFAEPITDSQRARRDALITAFEALDERLRSLENNTPHFPKVFSCP